MSSGKNAIPSPTVHFSDYQASLRASVDSVVSATTSLPDDISFHRSLDRQFGRRLDSSSTRVLDITSRLLDFIDIANVTGNASRQQSNDTKGKRRLDSEEDVVDNFHSIVVDILDQLLERADMALDELSGKIKPPAIPVNIQPEKVTKTKSKSTGNRLDSALVHASHIPKPQLLFRVLPDNRSIDKPWKPQLKTKPNATLPLEESISDDPSSSSHPYSYEISNFRPPPHLLDPPSTPAPPEPLESSPSLIYVSQASQLPELLQALSRGSEIAIDLEHHSYRSFSGFVCLMQISTRTQDWIIDCLDPGIRQELECLNEVFTNPNIVKVFHGADSDIVWLQQNFQLYIVNMFDTYHATKVLDFPKHSLAALLEMYCDFTADKRYQLADWRIRPLPTEMLDYARSDTHFLLYIYDNLRNALVTPRTPPPQQQPFEAGSPILEVIRRSSETALKVYVRETYDAERGTGPGGWEALCRKWNKSVGYGNDVHSVVFKAVHAWRDGIARREDESTRYVLPNHYLFHLAERPPSDLPGLLAIFQPVPPLVRAKSLELLDVIKDAVQRSAVKEKVPVTEAAVAVALKDDVDDNERVRIIGSPQDITTGIWDKLKTISNTAPTSTLFGSSIATPSYSTQTSTFLGISTHLEVSTKNEKYINAINRIHNTLTLSAPLPPQSKIVETTATSVVTTTTTTTSTTTAATATPSSSNSPEAPALNPAAVVEIPFIPSSQRPTIVQDPITNENVVVVGRQKKRKRKENLKNKDSTDADDNKETEGSPAPSKRQKSQDSKPATDQGTVDPYDFSAEKNILDESSSSRADSASQLVGKKRKEKRDTKISERKAEKSMFPPAPRNRSEMKNGNMAGTFK